MIPVCFSSRTYEVNVEDYVLYSTAVGNSSGYGRSACYTFLKDETPVIVEAMFTKFVTLNPILLSACKVVMIRRFKQTTNFEQSYS